MTMLPSVNMAQMDINAMRGINMVYVDSYLEKFPVLIGPGPFLLDYSKEMDAFLKSNSGIVSRIGYTMEFKDYNLDELILILKSMFKKAEAFNSLSESEISEAL